VGSTEGGIAMSDIFKRAVSIYGRDMQTVICIEEMAELTKELSKCFRGDGNVVKVAEELADVQIMLAQIPYVVCVPDEVLEFNEIVSQIKDEKIKRLEQRLNNEPKEE